MMISIIIPVFNGEKYISRCISTLNAQSYTDWEAIFVNDGSTDSSRLILEEAAKKDKRIKIFSQNNQGAAVARSLGMDKASGEYIAFLDVDDTLNKDFLQIMMNGFDNENTDIVTGTFKIVAENGAIIKRKQIKPGYMTGKEYLKKVLCGYYGWELWGKIFRKRLFNKKPVSPKGLRIGEDAYVFMQIVSNAIFVKIQNTALYNYFQYSSSASHTLSERHAEETLEAAFFIESFLKKKSFYEEIKKEISGMILLHFSNSTRRGVLPWHNRHAEKVRKEHLSLGALSSIPLIKAIYICVALYASPVLYYLKKKQTGKEKHKTTEI